MTETFDLKRFLISTISVILVLAVGFAVAGLLAKFRPVVQKKAPPTTLRSVEVATVSLSEVRTDIVTNGTVEPFTESQLVTEVAGRISSVSPRFEGGEIVDEGEVLLEIDRSIYEANVATARAEVAAAEAALDREVAEAAVAEDEWSRFGEGKASDLVLRKPQLSQARARVDAAEATLRRAQVDLERTTVRAPFMGRFRECLVDVGQYVTVGTPVATLYSIDFVEVRIPVPVDDLGFIDMSLKATSLEPDKAPTVILRARQAGKSQQWTGHLARTEGLIDPRTRTLAARVLVADPYALAESATHAPLLVGTFVEATIRGRIERGVASIPRAIVREHTLVPVIHLETSNAIDDEAIGSTNGSNSDIAHAEESADSTETGNSERKTGRLELREVEIVRLESDRALVRGLREGELIAVTLLDLAVDGMKVGIIPSEED